MARKYLSSAIVCVGGDTSEGSQCVQHNEFPDWESNLPGCLCEDIFLMYLFIVRVELHIFSVMIGQGAGYNY